MANRPKDALERASPGDIRRNSVFLLCFNVAAITTLIVIDDRGLAWQLAVAGFTLASVLCLFCAGLAGDRRNLNAARFAKSKKLIYWAIGFVLLGIVAFMFSLSTTLGIVVVVGILAVHLYAKI